MIVGKRSISILITSVVTLIATSSCGTKPNPTGLVTDAAAPIAVVGDGGAAVVPAGDIASCTACQQAGASAVPAWAFVGIYRDPACTEPLAQLTAAACSPIPALGPSNNLTYTDESGVRKAGATAQVTLTDQIPPEAPRFRKAGTACVKANEAAVDFTPINCGGLRVCRDATGALTCANASCRTLAGNGCPDFEETRMYSAFTDPGLKTAVPGNSNLARLRACCQALAAEATKSGNSPELTMAAAQCNALVAQAGPNGNAPELGALRAMLAGRNVPAFCAGF